AGHSVNLWAYHLGQAAKLAETRENAILLPGATLPPDILVTYDMEAALVDADGVVFVVPSQTVRENAIYASPFIPKGTWVVCASKGLEEGSHLRMSEVLKQNLTNNPS